jgi:hypothetical protein
MIGIVPRPSLVTWWSIQISVVARTAGPPSDPSRSSDATSHVTITAGSLGNADGGTSASVPGSIEAHRGGSKGSFGNEHTVCLPRPRRWFERPKIEPSASASGFT